MEESRKDKNMGRERSRERVEITRDEKTRREENRQKAMEERKCFVCGGFGYIVIILNS